MIHLIDSVRFAILDLLEDIMTNSKIVALAKILTNAANSDMRQAKASLKRNMKRASLSCGYVAILGTHSGNVEVEVTPGNRWNIRCGNGDFALGYTEADARDYLIDLYVIEDSEAA